MLTALILTSVVFVAGCTGLRALSRRYVTPPKPGIASDDSEIRPAIVSYVLSDCGPGTAAYDATILDLAARGYVGAASHPTGIWLTYSEPMARLPRYEQQVLDAAHGRLRNTGGAPFAVLAETYRVDVDGTWDPFDEKLREEAKRRGISRTSLPRSPAIFALAGVTSTAAVVLAVLIALVDKHHGPTSPIVTGLITAAVFPLVLAGAGWRERLTPYGASIAEYWRAERAALAATPTAWGFGPAIGGDPAAASGWADASPAALQRRAFAVAAGIPGAAGGLVSARRGRSGRRGGRSRGRRPTASQPSEAWSSFTGTWRLVPIKNPPSMSMRRGFVLIGIAFWIGLIAYAIDLAGAVEPIPPLGGLIAVVFGVGGVLDLVRVAVRIAGVPRRATFEGQVIARWQESTDSDQGSGTTACCAIDDGTRAWVFSGSTRGRAALEDLVRVTVNPRSEKLIDLVVTGHQRPETPTTIPMTPGARPVRPAEPLLSETEVTGLIGPVTRSTPVPSPGGYGMIYRGRDGTLSVLVTSGGIARFNTMISRKTGSPVAGIGDAAWLLNKDRTVIVRVGEQVAKLAASGRATELHPGLLTSFATMVAARSHAPNQPLPTQQAQATQPAQDSDKTLPAL